jgi:Tol biopolymer transport system component
MVWPMARLARRASGAIVAALASLAVAAAPGLAQPACDIQDIQFLSNGGDQDWSPLSDRIAYDRLDTDATYQLHTVKPDGSEDVCLSCSARPDSPRVDRHKTDPTWHPSGTFIVVQAEMGSHPLDWARHQLVSELILNGLWSNLYAVTPDGQRWFQLTQYSTTQADGALAPHFSPDGSRLLWSRMVAPASASAPFGVWRLGMADFVVDADGVPSLATVQDITPPGATFVESHGFTPDGTAVVFASDMGLDSPWSMDVWRLALASGDLVNLTHSPAYDEHATYSPGGRALVWMSSEPYPGTFLKTELFLAQADGSDKRQLTRFNVPGSAEFSAEASMPSRTSWSPDGRRLSITQQMGGAEYPLRHLWILTFSAACG